MVVFHCSLNLHTSRRFLQNCIVRFVSVVVNLGGLEDFQIRRYMRITTPSLSQTSSRQTFTTEEQ